MVFDAKDKLLTLTIGLFILFLVNSYSPQMEAIQKDEECIVCHEDIQSSIKTGNTKFNHNKHLLLENRCTACHTSNVHTDEKLKRTYSIKCTQCHAKFNQDPLEFK